MSYFVLVKHMHRVTLFKQSFQLCDVFRHKLCSYATPLGKSIRHVNKIQSHACHTGKNLAGNKKGPWSKGWIFNKLQRKQPGKRGCFHPGVGNLAPNVIGSVKKDINGWDIVKILFRHIWPKDSMSARRRVVVSLSLLITAKVVTVYVPIIFKHLVDHLNNPENFLNISTPQNTILTVATSLVIAYGIARMSAVLMNELKSAIFAYVAQKSIRKEAKNVFLHLHNMDFAYHQSRQTGALSKAIDRGTRGINTVLSTLLFNIAPTLFEVILTNSVLYYHFGINYAIAGLGCVGMYTAWTLGITQWRKKFRIQMNQADQEAGNRAVDSLLNYETVKYFNNEKYEGECYDKILVTYEQAALKTANSLSVLNFGQNIIVSSGLMAMMYFASGGVMDGSLTVGDLVMINGLLMQLALPLNFLGSAYRELRQSLIDMETMYALLDLKPAIKNKLDAPHIHLTSENSHIQFEDVVFSYEKGKNILNGLSFEVPSGKKVAIVGGSGSGKSTIVRLLYRFFDPQEGRILIGGRELPSIELENLRRYIGFVPQDPVLFHNSVFYNLQYGRIEAGEEEVYQAAKMAEIHETILKFPKQYETQVGERGVKLSGGEKQRVSIARAILKNSPIIVHDEATSSLDSITEHKILKTLKDVTMNRTTIVIAHRLSTVVDADEICVLDNGTIVERGRHQDLLKDPDNLYAYLWNKQHQAVLDYTKTPILDSDNVINNNNDGNNFK